jgi:acyl-CoA reductase-like NAD-dependent aldehyde dehydrogenase
VGDFQKIIPHQNVRMLFNFIANQSTPALAGQTLDVIDPSDGLVFDQIPRSQAADIDQAVQAARAAFNGPWGKLSALERGRLLMRLSQKILDHAAELTALEQRDCGKPTKQAAADTVALARYFEFYAGSCDKLHGETLPYQKRLQRAHLARTAWRDGARDSLELPYANFWPQRGRRIGRGQRVCGQTR